MKKIIPLILLVASLCFAVKVGILSKTNPQLCPWENYIRFALDVEDDNNQSGFFDGPGGAFGLSFPSGHAYFKICKVDFEILKEVSYNYVVFRLDSHCPAGTTPFRRHHDTEDDDPDNSYVGNIWPSVIGRNADLEFCFVPGTSGATNDFPLASPLDQEFGVFSNYRGGNIVRNTARIDDENDDNQNGWGWEPGTDQATRRNIKKIISDTNEDTYYYLIRKLTPLSRKTSVAEADIPIVVDDYAAVNKSATTEVKGLNHTTVSFELKSAGVADITIANAKGAVVSRISKEYLNPGVHSAEWHSGVLPNGLYIVTVKHNGTVSSKTFALK